MLASPTTPIRRVTCVLIAALTVALAGVLAIYGLAVCATMA
jgi:hypothetical protein